MLHTAGTPKAGETVLVHGAAGGVGTQLVQMAKQRRLLKIADAAASGHLSVTISETVPLSAVPAAVERNRTGLWPGKTVADLTLA